MASDDDRPDQAEAPANLPTPQEGFPPFHHVVGLGASAGGLEALETFFDHMPPDSGMSFVVIQHLSPDYKSLMPELLSKRTAMPVVHAEDGMPVRPNTVFLNPPKKMLTISEGCLRLTERDHRHGFNFPIDVFLTSMAEAYGEKAIAVILSGTGTDGTRGIRRVKECGGMVMVQDEASAKFDGMPRSAAATGLADFIAGAEHLPEQLLMYLKHPATVEAALTERALVAAQSDLTRILNIVRDRTGVDFGLYKSTTILRRVTRRMTVNQIERMSDYLEYVRHAPREAQVLFKEMIIGVTRFFRDPDAFELLQREIIPQIFEDARNDRQIRVWVAGCSTGEEAYSIAMLLLEYMEETGSHYDVKIFATDIDKEALEFAGAGAYPESIAADVSPERLNRYVTKKGDFYQVNRRLREIVVFAVHNIVKDPPFTKIHLLSCRNLLIYLQPTVQRKIISLFHFALQPDGALLLGPSETVGDFSDQFDAINMRWKAYRKRGVSRPIGSQGYVANSMLATPIGLMPRSRTRPLVDEDRTMGMIYENIIQEFAPACLVLDERNEILHIFGDVSAILRIPPGRATFDALKLLPRDLSIALATALRKSAKEQKAVLYKGVQATTPQGSLRIDLRVRPLPIETRLGRLTLAFLENIAEGAPPPPDTETFDVEDSAKQRIKDLEQELQQVRESLQATIEELEAANEELQATNEELLASNEELQSTNEELHSVNEELYTVNAEYQSKIQELTEVNNDLDNILSSLDVGAILLDEQLTIRKFNPAVTASINVLPQDVGRPISHLSRNIDYEDLVADAKRVLQDHQSVQREIPASDHRWLLVRLMPYQNESKAVNGVTIMMVDITKLKEAEKLLRDNRQLLESILDVMRVGVCVTNEAGNFVRVNAAFCELTGFAGKELINQSLAAIAPAGDRENTMRRHREVIDGAPDGVTRLTLQRKGGEALPVVASSARIVREDCQRFRVMTIHAIDPKSPGSQPVA